MAERNFTQNELAPVPAHKLVVVGDHPVGKTSIITRFVHNLFSEDPVSIDHILKKIDCQHGLVSMRIWDTAGQEKHGSMQSTYARNCAAAIIVFDISRKVTFDNTSSWFEKVRAVSKDDCVIVLVGNKADLFDKRQVSNEEATAKAVDLGVQYYETSAKDGTNIEEPFNSIAGSLPVTEVEDDADHFSNTPCHF